MNVVKNSVFIAAGLCGLVFVSGCFLAAPLHEETRHSVLSHVPDAPIHVTTVNGKISVIQAAREDVSIEARVRATSPERLEQTAVTPQRASDGTLTVAVSWPDGKRRSREGCDLAIQTPDARGLQLRSSNGSITVQNLRGMAYAKTSNGSITVNGQQGAVDAKTSNGKIKVEGAQGSAKLESSNGSITARGIAGAVDAVTSNGSVEVALGSGSSGPIQVRSSNGSVNVSVGGLQGELQLKTSNGKLKFGEGLPGRVVERSKKSALLQFGVEASPASSTLRTSNGSITVRP